MNIKLFNTKITLSYPLVAGLTLILVLDYTGMAFCCVLSAFCHELGHILAIGYFKAPIKEINLSAFDINIKDLKKYQRPFKAEIIITLSGVFVNYVLFLLAIMLYNSSNLYIIKYFAMANLSLGIFNTLPVETLDGGNALQLILQRNFSDKAVYVITLITSLICVIPIGILGFLVLLRSPYNFTILGSALYLVSAIVSRIMNTY